MGWQSGHVAVEGIEETVAKLHEFGVEKAPRIVRKGVLRGAKILRDAIRDEAESSFAGKSRTDPGGLLRGISARSVRGGIGYDVGPQGKGTAHRHLVIRGHNVTHHKGGPVSGRTRANPFVARGEAKGAVAAKEAIAVAFREATAEVWR